MQRGIVKNYYSDSDFTVMWAGDEHFSITAQALNILLNDGKITAYSIYYPYIDILKEYSKKPDLDESIGGTHYYVYEGTPSTNGGYYKNNNGNYSRSARTRFENHYSSAINLYKNDKYGLAMQYLGRALHYIEDIGATPHSAGISDSDSWFYDPHKQYESWVNDNYDNYPEFMANSSSKYNYVLNTNFQTITNDLAQDSSGYKNDVEDRNESEYYNVTINTLPLTQEIVAGILNRFYEDVENNSSLNYIKDGASYFLKNKSGYYLDINDINSNFQLNTNQNCSNMEFKIKVNNDGTFRLIPEYAPDKVLTINEETRDIELSAYTDSITQKFKFTYLENGNYRIMVGYYHGEGDFAYALGVDDSSINIGSDVKSLYYNPDDLGGNGQEWYLELHSHTSYSIIKDNDLYHNAICNIYGTVLEQHEWYFDGIKHVCSKCGMINYGIIIVPLDLQEINEDK